MIKTGLKIAFSKRKMLSHCNTSCQKVLTNIPYKAAKGRKTIFLKTFAYYSYNLKKAM